MVHEGERWSLISFPVTAHFKLARNSYLILHTFQNQLMHPKHKFNTILQSCNSRNYFISTQET
jgi:hypothetical protein